MVKLFTHKCLSLPYRCIEPKPPTSSELAVGYGTYKGICGPPEPSTITVLITRLTQETRATCSAYGMWHAKTVIGLLALIELN